MNWANKTIFVLMVISMSVMKSYGQINEVNTLSFETDLVPEGIAIDPITKQLYLNSLTHDKIVTSNLDGSNARTFINENEYGYLAGFGMTIKGDTLYALGNSNTAENNKSVLLRLQLSTGLLIDSYVLDDSEFHFLNDLAISSKNEIYITDSESNKIYKVNRKTNKIEVFIDSEKIARSNGITISTNNKYLYVASIKGIRVIELDTKEIINSPNDAYIGIDGLKFHQNSLYGIVNVWFSIPTNNGLYKYELNANGNEIINKEQLIVFTEEFEVPTTFDIMDSSIYFIMNTQLNNINQGNDIIDSTKLQSLKLMKVDLSDTN